MNGVRKRVDLPVLTTKRRYNPYSGTRHRVTQLRTRLHLSEAAGRLWQQPRAVELPWVLEHGIYVSMRRRGVARIREAALEALLAPCPSLSPHSCASPAPTPPSGNATPPTYPLLCSRARTQSKTPHCCSCLHCCCKAALVRERVQRSVPAPPEHNSTALQCSASLYYRKGVL